MQTLSERDFVKLANFTKVKFGLDLEKKQQLLISRLANVISSRGFSSFSEYVDFITTTKDSGAIDEYLNKVTTNYTYFMREHSHFDYFKNTVLPYLEHKKAGSKVLGIWSAGCSSGQEPYTLAILLKEHFANKPGWDTRVLATDISLRALSAATKGVYPADGLRDFPKEMLKKYFKMRPDGHYEVIDEIKKNVVFRKFNLMDPISFKLKFDVIFCRNVMIYYDKDTRDALTRRFNGATNPEGYLFIGHSEVISENITDYKFIASATYRRP